METDVWGRVLGLVVVGGVFFERLAVGEEGDGDAGEVFVNCHFADVFTQWYSEARCLFKSSSSSSSKAEL